MAGVQQIGGAPTERRHIDESPSRN